MRRPATWLALVLLLAGAPTLPGGASHAEDSPVSAGSCTLRGRSMDRSLDEILAPGQAEADEARTIVFVVDASPGLKGSGFARALRGATERARRGRSGDRLARTRIAVLDVRPKSRAVVGEPGDPEAVLVEIEGLLAAPRSEFADVYDAVRRGARVFSGSKGGRELVLVTLENGDVESDLEGAVKAAARADAVVSVLTWQTFLSDTYWTVRASEVPRGMEPHGGEAAFVELPWGFLFQNATANEHTGSGFGAFGLTRLAAATGGRVYLFDDGKTSEHECTVVGTTCTFCTTDHLPEGTAYQTGLLDGFGPLVTDRKDALDVAARDPYFSATLAAWDAATDAGLVRSQPSVKRSGAGLKLAGGTSSRVAELGQTLGFSREARNADELAATCGDIADRLREAIDGVTAGEGAPRMRANAEIAYGLLRLTRLNILGFAAWCRDVGPALLDRGIADRPFPEYPALSAGFRPTGISYTGLSLCHGVAPFLRQGWPGGDAFRAELESFGKVHDRLLAEFAGTPYGMAIRRSSIARFQLAGIGKYVPPAPRERPDGDGEDATTGTGRKPRAGPSGGEGGTTTGDK